MNTSAKFKQDLVDAVNARHCRKHTLAQRWAEGTLSRRCLMGVAVEGYHWVSNLVPHFLELGARGPKDLMDMELDNYAEETNPNNPHPQLFLRFAGAAGADVEAVKRGRGLPSTESWLAWELRVIRDEKWENAVAAVHVGSEFQSTGLYEHLIPVLLDKYGFTEHEIEHFVVHSSVDVEHSSRAFECLAKHCDTREKREEAIHFAAESARMRWFYFDGIYTHYELNIGNELGFDKLNQQSLLPLGERLSS